MPQQAMQQPAAPQMPAQAMAPGMGMPQAPGMDPNMGMQQAPGMDPNMGMQPQVPDDPFQEFESAAGTLTQKASELIGGNDDQRVADKLKWAMMMLASQGGKVFSPNDKQDIANAMDKAGNVDNGMFGQAQGAQGQMPQQAPMQQPMGQMPMMAHRAPRRVMESTLDGIVSEIADELVKKKEERGMRRPEKTITNKKVKRTNPFVCER